VVLVVAAMVAAAVVVDMTGAGMVEEDMMIGAAAVAAAGKTHKIYIYVVSEFGRDPVARGSTGLRRRAPRDGTSEIRVARGAKAPCRRAPSKVRHLFLRAVHVRHEGEVFLSLFFLFRLASTSSRISDGFWLNFFEFEHPS